MRKTVTPYGEDSGSKREQIELMFDNIAAKYDFLNRLLSLGIDTIWRKKAIGLLAKYQPKKMADIASGTGDFAFEALKLNPEKVYAIDISEGMLSEGRKKAQKRGLENQIEFIKADSESLPYQDDFFDAMTVGFGVRNFDNLEKGLGEMRRCLRPGGGLAILEPSMPVFFPLKQIFYIYFKYFTPFIGRLISKDKKAYEYLPESVEAFPEGEKFVAILKNVGYQNVVWKPLTFGICSLYLCEK